MLYRYFIAIVFIGALSLSSVVNSSKKEGSLLRVELIPVNTPPVVKFISPKANSKFKRNTLIPYSIEVSDREDGESKYQEIAPEEVFLEVKMFTDNAAAGAYLQKEVHLDPAGFYAVKKSDCFNCHNQKTKLIGPSFEEISKRYALSPVNTIKIADHIRKGVSGNWGEAVMPAHPDISADVATQIAQWILKNGSDSTVDYQRGIEGTFWFKPASPKPGIYVLTASYNDHGNGENPETSLKGSERILITEKMN